MCGMYIHTHTMVCIDHTSHHPIRSSQSLTPEQPLASTTSSIVFGKALVAEYALATADRVDAMLRGDGQSVICV